MGGRGFLVHCLCLVQVPPFLVLFAMLTTVLAGCRIRDAELPSSSAGSSWSKEKRLEAGPSQDLRGRITIDGSSTVYPITQAAAEEFVKQSPHVAIPIGVAGTGGGFKRFVADDLDICDASRPIEPDEAARCHQNGVKYLELAIGLDGLSVVVNQNNTWCDVLSVDQLKAIWESGSTIRYWDQLDPGYPHHEIVLYGPDTDSGTFEYFTQVICGRRGNSRADYTPSSNDNILIQGVEGDAGALGYFGYAYFSANRNLLKALRIGPARTSGAKEKEAGREASKEAGIAPSDETILDGAYPLSRPLFLYVNRKALARPETAAFLTFFLDHAPALVAEVHCVPLPAAQIAKSRARLANALQTP